MKANKQTLFAIGAIYILSLWVILAFDIANDRHGFLPVDINSYGIQPRTAKGLLGIMFAPFLHGNHAHFIANAVPLIILGFTTMIFYEKAMLKSVITIVLLSGLVLWLFGRGSYMGYDLVKAAEYNITRNHIGASDLIFGLFGFLIINGLFTRNFKAFLIAVFIIVFEGLDILIGILPYFPKISWEGHAFGLLSGVVAAILFRRDVKRSLKQVDAVQKRFFNRVMGTLTPEYYSPKYKK